MNICCILQDIRSERGGSRVMTLLSSEAFDVAVVGRRIERD